MGQTSCGGRTSRNLVITLQGGHLLCTYQDSDVMSMAQHGLWPRGDRFQGRMACDQLADAPRVSAPRRRPYLEAEAAQDARRLISMS